MEESLEKKNIANAIEMNLWNLLSLSYSFEMIQAVENPNSFVSYYVECYQSEGRKKNTFKLTTVAAACIKSMISDKIQWTM